MHELSIAEAIADKVRTRAAGRPVSAVAVRVGKFRQIVPDALELCWTMVAEATGLAGCRLEIEQVPATVRCDQCDAGTTLDVPILLCGACGSSDVRLVTGEEFLLLWLEIAEAV
jgi:hydrogenase nickel incorporation protein HypA/HybF